MLVDMTLPITPAIRELEKVTRRMQNGHLGTHFDVMGKVFPLEYTERKGIIFDIRHITGRDVEVSDIDLSKVGPDMFVAFCSSFMEQHAYEEEVYGNEHPQLSDELIDKLLEKKISIIGVDFAGVRRSPDHHREDVRCAEEGVFIIENLDNLKNVLAQGESFTAFTFPVNFTEQTGLPCRVVAKF